MVDASAYGGTHAAEILADKLSARGDKQLQRRIGSFIDHTFRGFSQLAAVEDDALFVEFVVLWRNKRLSLVDFDGELDSFICSIIMSMSRDWIRSIEVSS